MHEEEIELALKIDRLNEFINGTKFMSLSPLQQRLLEAQQSAMSSYLKILRIRIEVEQDNYRNENDAQSVESYSSRLQDRQRVVVGKSFSVRFNSGGCRFDKKNT